MLSQLPFDLWLLVLMHLCERADAATFRALLAIDTAARDFRIPVQVWSDCIRQRVLRLTSGLYIGSKHWDVNWLNMNVYPRARYYTNVFKIPTDDMAMAIVLHKQVARNFLPLLKEYFVNFLDQPRVQLQMKHMVAPCPNCETTDYVQKGVECGVKSRYTCGNPLCTKMNIWTENIPYTLICRNLMRSLELDCPYDQFLKRGPHNFILACGGMLQDDKTRPIGRNVAIAKVSNLGYEPWQFL